MQSKIGQEAFVKGLPELSLVANEEWCSEINVERHLGECIKVAAVSETATKKIFTQNEDDVIGASEQLKEGKPMVVEHYDVVTFSHKETNAEHRIGFLIDNKDEKEEHASAFIYSWEKQKMIFNGIAVSPGEEYILRRSRHDDVAFCLTRTPTFFKDDETPNSKKSARQIFEDLVKSEKNISAFSIMLTRAVKPRPVRGMLLGTDEVDGPSLAPRGLSVEIDGPCLTPEKRRCYASLVEGGKTHQKFKEIDLNYEGAPIHIYNVVVLLK